MNDPVSPLRLLIVDDEAPARQRLRTVLGDLAGELPHVLVGEAEHGVAALALLDSFGPVDVVLTDVRMPRMDGVELARHLRRRESSPAVIFTTAYDDYAVAAFDVAAVDYLMKPIRAVRLAEALRKVVRQPARPVDTALADLQGGPRQFLTCTERGRHLLVPVADLLYLRADAKYVLARTSERDYLLDESLTHLEAEFGARFLRLHRAVLVARDALVGLESARASDGEFGWALLRGVPERLPVSRRQWGEARRFLAARAGGSAGH